MKTLSIITPTYNRGEMLEKVYRSLALQTSNDFIWLIVDDGSTDGTEKAVEGFIVEGIVEIEYYKKENGGKHTAVNEALSRVKTPYVMLSLDSDDTLKPTAVETVNAECNNHPECRGAVFMKENSKGESYTDYRDPLLKIMPWRTAICEGHYSGEALLVLESGYIKKYRYPVIEGERFFTEAYVYLQLTEPLYWSSESVYVAEYLDGGYTKSIVSVFLKNPKSFAMYNDLRCSLFPDFIKRFKYAAYYDAFSILSSKKHFVKSCSRPYMSFLALLPSLIFLCIIKFKNRLCRP